MELVDGTDHGMGRGRWMEHGRNGRRESGSELASAWCVGLAVHGAGGAAGARAGARAGAAQTRMGSVPRAERAGDVGKGGVGKCGVHQSGRTLYGPVHFAEKISQNTVPIDLV